MVFIFVKKIKKVIKYIQQLAVWNLTIKELSHNSKNGPIGVPSAVAFQKQELKRYSKTSSGKCNLKKRSLTDMKVLLS